MADDILRGLEGAKQTLTKADKAIEREGKKLSDIVTRMTMSMGDAEKAVSVTVKDMIKLEQNKQVDQKVYKNNLKVTAAAMGTSTDVLEKTIQENNLVFDSITGDLVNLKDSSQEFAKSIAKMNGVVAKDLKDTGDAIKELTGGIVDLNGFFGDGMTKVNAAMTVVATPFKMLNSTIVATAGFFGKEFNPGQTMLDWWQGTEEDMIAAGERGKTGFQGVLQTGFETFVESGKALGAKLGELAQRSPMENLEAAKESLMSFPGRLKEGIVALGQGIANTAKAMLKGALRLGKALGMFLVNSVVFVAGLLMTGATLLAAGIAAAAPAILIGLGIAALIAGIVLIVQNFEAIKTTVQEKFTAMVDKVKGIFTAIVDKIKDIGQMVKDWIREKILGLKSWLPGGLSKEEEQELKDIEKRKEERAKGKQKEQEVFEETEKINQEALKNKENLTKKEEENIKIESEQQARTDIAKKETKEDAPERRYNFDKKIDRLKREEERLQKAAERTGNLKADKAQEEKDIVAEVAEKGSIDLTKYEGTEKYIEQFGGTIDASNAAEFAKARAEDIYGSDAEIKARDEQAMNKLTDKQFELANEERKREKYLAGDDIEASRVMSRQEIRELEDEKHRESLGLSKEEYDAKKKEDMDKFLESATYGYEGPKFESEFMDSRKDIELSAQDIRDAAARRDEEKATGMDGASTNASMNAVQQVNIGNTTMSVKDPAPHNPEPTGSRLSVVPA